MAREFFDHTGDIGVTLHAATLPELYREAALAFTETVTTLDTIRTSIRHNVELSASGLDDLMVRWLDELLYRFEVQNVLVREADVTVEQHGTEWRLHGTLQGEPFDSVRHEVKVLIKGVTYHRLHVRCADDEWRTDLVFDI